MRKQLFYASLALVLLAPCEGRAEDVVLHVTTQSHPLVRALQDGRVQASGCVLHLSTETLDAIDQDLASGKRLDVAEVDLLWYLRQKSEGGLSGYTLLPIFLSRSFQLRNIYIRTDRGIKGPEDLRGKRVGIAGKGSATPTWIVGILQSSWSVKPEEITWVDVETSTGPKRSLSKWLVSGQVDAIFSSDTPKAFADKDPKIARLFPDYEHAEYDAFQVTRIFPILTAVAIREDLVQQNAWLPEALFNAFSESKKRTMADMTLPLPWGGDQLDETEKLMGKNFWSYGVKSNPKTLGALFHYAESQGVLKKKMSPDDVFESSTILLIEP